MGGANMQAVLGVFGFPEVMEVVPIIITLGFFGGVIVAILKVLRISRDTREIQKTLIDIKKTIDKMAR
jgi:hypothetical protein